MCSFVDGLGCGVGEWVLVTASAGGVGIAAVQLAKGAPSSFASVSA